MPKVAISESVLQDERSGSKEMVRFLVAAAAVCCEGHEAKEREEKNRAENHSDDDAISSVQLS